MKKKASQKFSVQGMHCPACELLIERYLRKEPGVTAVKASLADKTVLIETRAGVSQNQILAKYNQLLGKHGYKLSQQADNQVGYDRQTVINAIIILATLGLVVYFLNSSQWLAGVNLQPDSSLVTFFGFGLVAGFSTCAALVGGLMLSLSQQWQQTHQNISFIQKTKPFILFNLGRLMSFVGLGAILGLLGSALQLSLTASAVVTMIVSFIIIVLGLQMLGIKFAHHLRLQIPSKLAEKLSDDSRFQGQYMPFLAGAGTFFLPCGFTLMAQMLALSTGSWWLSGIMMLFFALGTLPSLILLSFTSIRWQGHKVFGPTFNLVTGILVVILGLYNLNSQLLVLGLPNLNTALSSLAKQPTGFGLDAQGLGTELKTKNGQTKQYAYVLAKGFEYFPKKLNLVAGMPTEFKVRAQGVLGCAITMSLPGLTDEIIYLNKPESKIEFIPTKGTYYISCSMGMVKPIVVEVK